MKFLTRADSLYFQVFLWHFYFMRGHSLIELTEHDNSATDIMVLYIVCTYVCIAEFIVHNVYRYRSL